MSPAARLASYLAVPETDPQFALVLSQFSPERQKLLAVFPFLALMHGLSEKENAKGALIAIEATLFNVFWVDSFIDQANCFEQCRKKIADILWAFTKSCDAAYLKDPVLCVWAVVRSLIVERNARTKGLAKLLRSKEVAMLDRVIADCQAHRERGLPADLADRLRILESHGVFFPSDIYPVVADSMARRR
jgi:hypothetical protein